VTRRTEIRLFDDIDGAPAAETLRFALDGTTYEIDLHATHATQLRELMATFIVNGRRLGRAGRLTSSRNLGGSPAPVDRAQNQAIRDWAKRRGIELSPRGRIPISVARRYEDEAGRLPPVRR
jgi:hypothetical protein